MNRLLSIIQIMFVSIAMTAQVNAGQPVVPPTPAAVDDILYVRPFTLEKGYRFEWSREKPLLNKGVILVLKVNPDLV